MKSIHKNMVFLSGVFSAALIADPCAAFDPVPATPSSIKMNIEDFKSIEPVAVSKTPRLKFSYRGNDGTEFLSGPQRDYREKLEYDRYTGDTKGISGKLSGAKVTITMPFGTPPPSPANR